MSPLLEPRRQPWRTHTTRSSSGPGTTGSSPPPTSRRAATRSSCSNAATSSAGAASPRNSGPGFKVSTAAYVNSLLRPEIIRDLELKKYGFEMLPRSPSSFTPFPDGRYLMMGPDKEMTHREIAKFSKKDAEAYPKYEDMLTRVADFLEPMLTQTPPDPFSMRPGQPLEARQARHELPPPGTGRGQRGGRDPDRRSAADPRPLVRVGGTQGHHRHRRRHRRVRRAVAARHRVRAVPPRHGRVQRRPRRVGLRPRRHGDGLELASPPPRRPTARRFARTPRSAEILVHDGVGQGVALKDGTEFRAKRVASGADANVTFNKLMDPKDLPDGLPRGRSNASTTAPRR